MSTKPAIYAVIPAAGIGTRMQADRPKQYLTLAGKTILEHTLNALASHAAISEVIVALHPDDPYFTDLPVAGSPWLTTVTGGNERADSVLNALRALSDDSWALVHDAARPCLDHEDIDRLLTVTDRDDVAGGILATPVRDTMKRAHAGQATVAHTESRDDLWHALTPQLFPTGLLRQALTDGLAAGQPITDEASAMELAGFEVALIDANPANIKITRPADLPLAAFYLQQQT
ncbi:2-C-methyl-D-erythritol 4-phosphate cytidylyltransferase [Alteromonas sp. ASW11-19]|uniref:2-C-methyl-D-erythritol 4-phosphate cytidylyltransferase n=1 Tax=Alteromonas salexigens TaxID=2982530 RepID=A0ABT2VIZ2_9ALTE|nr:2-C-methyl-D-erythritol 4-phosphate cytidylyltransferase [Alteromonas salexigens]MCU7552994.1 2-C-methyl-D-erythritol 4-phosphate cytidylyltransferase [Alteromonas salexigens]